MSRHYEFIHMKFDYTSMDDNKVVINEANNSIKYKQHVYTITYVNELTKDGHVFNIIEAECIRTGAKVKIKKRISLCIDDMGNCSIAISTYKNI